MKKVSRYIKVIVAVSLLLISTNVSSNGSCRRTNEVCTDVWFYTYGNKHNSYIKTINSNGVEQTKFSFFTSGISSEEAPILCLNHPRFDFFRERTTLIFSAVPTENGYEKKYAKRFAINEKREVVLSGVPFKDIMTSKNGIDTYYLKIEFGNEKNVSIGITTK